MLTIEQALDTTLERCHPLPARSTPLSDALGLTLAEEITADIDLPPFDKALMDGYAVRSIDFQGLGDRRFRITEEIVAGRSPRFPLGKGEAARIMTGAPLPSGADAVVMVERSRLVGDQVVLEGPTRPGLNRLTRGREMRAGETLLRPGCTLDAAKIGLIASVGRSLIQAIPRPTVAIVPTGDEIVPITQFPQAGQIRNSNGVMLTALVRSLGLAEGIELPIASDDPVRLKSALREALNASDVILVCGGVSAGTKDLVPATLNALGVETIFHKVNLKPGKPLWFGLARDRVSRSGPLVFGLPGNPVSGVVCVLLFVRPALAILAGRAPERTQLGSARLGASYTHRGDRPTYHPSRLVEEQVYPLDWAGSSDLRTVALADGFAVFPPGDAAYQIDDPVGFLPLR